jgi:hypothetical protein
VAYGQDRRLRSLPTTLRGRRPRERAAGTSMLPGRAVYTMAGALSLFLCNKTAPKGKRHSSKGGRAAQTELKAEPNGCPTFAPAYVGRKSGATRISCTWRHPCSRVRLSLRRAAWSSDSTKPPRKSGGSHNRFCLAVAEQSVSSQLRSIPEIN